LQNLSASAISMEDYFVPHPEGFVGANASATLERYTDFGAAR